MSFFTVDLDILSQGMSVWREGKDEHCYFRMLMGYESPLVLSRIVDTAEARKEEVDSSSMMQVLIWASIDSEMSEQEIADLSSDMKNLCYRVPIMKMTTDRLEMKDFQSKIEKAGECYTGHTALKDGKSKREAKRREVTCTTCSHGCPPPYRPPCGGGGVFSQRPSAESGLRGKRSISTGYGTSQLVHLIIGHERFGCE